MPAVKLFWYDGMKQQPEIPGVPAGELIGDLPSVPVPRGSTPPAETSPYVGDVFNYEKFLEVQKNPNARTPSPNGSLFIGDKGMLTTGTYGEDTRLIPVSRIADYKFPDKVLTRSPGHYNDWIRACKGGEQACSNFNVALPSSSGCIGRADPAGKLGTIPRRCASPTMRARTNTSNPSFARAGLGLEDTSEDAAIIAGRSPRRTQRHSSVGECAILNAVAELRSPQFDLSIS